MSGIGLGSASLSNVTPPRGTYHVTGLVGNNNAATPSTQFDFSADVVQLRNPTTGSVVIRTSTGTITNNISTAGPAANGRDQAGAFSSSSWIHFYFIWNGSTLATVSSATAPPTGPTLPTGYTHWAYISAVRYNATPILLPTKIRNAQATYDLSNGSENRVLAPFGTSTAMTAVDCSAYVPPNSQLGYFGFIMRGSSSAGRSLYIRQGASTQTGMTLAVGPSNGQSGSEFGAGNAFFPTNSTQRIDYSVDALGGAIIDVLGYIVSNGGE